MTEPQREPPLHNGGSALVSETGPSSAVENPAQTGAVHGLFVTLGLGTAALERAWKSRRSSWDKLSAWTWTIGHTPKAPPQSAPSKPEDT